VRNNTIGWIFLLLVLISACLISFFENFSAFFLLLLIVGLLLVILLRRSFSVNILTVARSILGVTFIYSGLVKGIDPVGTEYRIVDYFIAFGTDWANPLALPLSVFLNAAEFILGILLLFNIRMKITVWLAATMMFIFTVVTINDALNNPVPDCGCFGDALIISNWQTFYKNLVIDILLLMILLNRNKISAWFSLRAEIVLAGLFLVFFTGFEIYNIRHLPVLDFRAWKVGRKMAHENPLPEQYYLTYKNKITGEQKEYLSPNYPYSDSSWIANWTFVSQRVVDPNPPLHDLHLEDDKGIDHTAALIENSNHQFLLIAYDLDNSSLKQIEKIRNFIYNCNEQGFSFAMITSTIPTDAVQFLSLHELDADVYYADDISLMAMIRSNPGLVLLKDAVILDKWHYNDWPELDKIDLKIESEY